MIKEQFKLKLWTDDNLYLQQLGLPLGCSCWFGLGNSDLEYNKNKNANLNLVYFGSSIVKKRNYTKILDKNLCYA